MCRLLGGRMFSLCCRCLLELLLFVMVIMVVSWLVRWCRVLSEVVSLCLLLSVMMVGWVIFGLGFGVVC